MALPSFLSNRVQPKDIPEDRSYFSFRRQPNEPNGNCLINALLDVSSRTLSGTKNCYSSEEVLAFKTTVFKFFVSFVSGIEAKDLDGILSQNSENREHIQCKVGHEKRWVNTGIKPPTKAKTTDTVNDVFHNGSINRVIDWIDLSFMKDQTWLDCWHCYAFSVAMQRSICVFEPDTETGGYKVHINPSTGSSYFPIENSGPTICLFYHSIGISRSRNGCEWRNCTVSKNHFELLLSTSSSSSCEMKMKPSAFIVGEFGTTLLATTQEKLKPQILGSDSLINKSTTFASSLYNRNVPLTRSNSSKRKAASEDGENCTKKVVQRRHDRSMLVTLPNFNSSDEENDSTYEEPSIESSDTNDSEPYYESDDFCLSSEITNSNSESSQLHAWKDLFQSGAASTSKLSRDRKTRAASRPSSLPRKNRSGATNLSYAPKSVSVIGRVREVPNEGLECHNTRFFCTYCTVDVGLKMSMIKQHILSKMHLNRKLEFVTSATNTKIGTQSLITTVIRTERADRYDSGSSFVIAEDVDTYRCQVAYAFLLDGIAFHTLKNPQDAGIRRILESKRHTLPQREISDCIPLVLKVEVSRVLNELDGAPFSIIFDGTPNVEEVFGIVIRFVCKKTFKIKHRALALRFYGQSFDKVGLASAIIKIIIEDNHLSLASIRGLTSDGCPVNAAAIAVMRPLIETAMTPICISHASNVVGKIFKDSCPVAIEFESAWSQMMHTSGYAKSLFKRLSGNTVLNENEVRWYSWCEIIIQIGDNMGACQDVIHCPDEFADASRRTLRNILVANSDDLVLEIALIKDVGSELIKLCYFQEGDGFLCVTTFGHWEKILALLKILSDDRLPLANKVVLLPTLDLKAQGIAGPNPQLYARKMVETLRKVIPVYEKMVYDSSHRMEPTLALLRGLRLLNFEFVGNTNILALQTEWIQLCRIPAATLQFHVLELEKYKELADVENSNPPDCRLSLWEFWLKYGFLHLPNLFSVACEAALLAASSGCVERLFSLLTSIFADTQQSALEDYKSVSCLLRFNTAKRKSE